MDIYVYIYVCTCQDSLLHTSFRTSRHLACARRKASVLSSCIEQQPGAVFARLFDFIIMKVACERLSTFKASCTYPSKRMDALKAGCKQLC